MEVARHRPRLITRTRRRERRNNWRAELSMILNVCRWLTKRTVDRRESLSVQCHCSRLSQGVPSCRLSIPSNQSWRQNQIETSNQCQLEVSRSDHEEISAQFHTRSFSLQSEILANTSLFLSPFSSSFRWSTCQALWIFFYDTFVLSFHLPSFYRILGKLWSK